MISAGIIQNSIEDLKAITKAELVVVNELGAVVADTSGKIQVEEKEIEAFIASPADTQAIAGHLYLKVFDETEVVYVIVCEDSNEDYTIAKIAVCQLQSLIVAYKERFDKNNFFQNLILDNLLLVDIYNRAKKLHIEIQVPRIVCLVETNYDKDNGALEMLKSLFSSQTGDFVTAVDERSIIIIKQLEGGSNYQNVEEICRTIVDMIRAEAMIKVKVAYGNRVDELKDVSKSYKEAKMALEVGKIFYADKDVISYGTLGIGRLIYQLPVSLCKMFITEIFGQEMPDNLDEETLNTVNIFLENNLNVSETARKLFVHRNTLLYRLEKLQKSTGLDIRVFDDALTLKIALMVVNYLKSLESEDYL